MPTTPPTRSVRISDDERGGWSSDRPRRDGAPPRPANLAVRCRLLRPADRLRYSPGSLAVIVSGSKRDRDAFAARLVDEPGVLISLDKVRALIAGRVPDDQLDDKATALLDATISKRMAAGDTVVVVADGLESAERERYVRLALAHRRPRHILLIDVGKDAVAEEDLGTINELRRALDAGELGAEGFQTALRLGGDSIGDVKRIVFAPPPKDD